MKTSASKTGLTPAGVCRWVTLLMVMVAALGLQGGFTLLAENTEDTFRFRYHALLIGVPNLESETQNVAITDVVTEMETVLERRYGFEVATLLAREASISNIEGALRNYVETLTAQDSLLIVYAGATEMDAYLQESYWITAPESEEQAYSRAAENWFSCNRVIKYISAMNARHILLLNEGDFAWNKQRGVVIQAKTQREINRLYEKLAAQPSRQILTRPWMESETRPEMLSEILEFLQSQQSDLAAAAELVSWYRDRTGDRFFEFGRLYDFKGSMKGDFVFSKSEGGVRMLENHGLPIGSGDALEAAFFENSSGSSSELKKESAGTPTVNIPYQSGQMASLKIELEETGNQEDGIISNFGCESTFDSIVGRAIRFENRSFLKFYNRKLKDLPSGDFTITCWFKSDRKGPYPLFANSSSDRGIGVNCNGNNYLEFSAAGPKRTAHYETIPSKMPIEPGKWYFLVFSKSGNKLSAYLNRELQGSFEAGYVTFSGNSEEGYLGSIANSEGGSITYDGIIDEFRIFDTALGAEHLDAIYREKFLRFGVSPTLATDSEDLDRIARMSFGSTSRMADWRVLKDMFEGECEEFMDAIGLKHWETAFVRCDGRRIWKDNRHFLVTRHSGTPRDYYLVHETMDDHQLDLGSWYQTSCTVLIQKY